MTRLTSVLLENIRCHSRLELDPGEKGWVLLAGGNGSGKTSILEGIYFAARGRSFRGAGTAEILKEGTQTARILLRTQNQREHMLGVALQAKRKEIRLDGEAAELATVAETVPVEYIGGETVQLFSAPPAARRRFLDWALFHVEPQFLSVWRSWYRAHRQRNTLLRLRANGREVAPWTEAVITYGERVSGFRAEMIKRLDAGLLEREAPEVMRGCHLEFRRGWRGTDLRGALEQSKQREAQAGRAVVGPQFDDWFLGGCANNVSGLSRGQSKLCSLALYRSRVEVMSAALRKPVLLIDDIMADLDRFLLDTALDLWRGLDLQVWITMLGEHATITLPAPANRIHVEHGRVVRIG